MGDEWDENPGRNQQRYGNSSGNYGGGGGGYRGGQGGQRPSNRSGNFNPGNSYGGNNWRSEPSGGDGNAITIEVPSRFVGRIIGRGGSKISELQCESGARINVTKEVNGDNTVIRISGSSEEIDKAKEMVEDLCIDRPPGRQY